jgi:hypothetical protein
MFGASVKVHHRYWYPRCSYVSVIVIISDAAFKIRQLFETTSECCPLPFVSKKICEIQITPTICCPTLGIIYCLQITETGFAEQFYASHRMGPASICLKITARIA